MELPAVNQAINFINSISVKNVIHIVSTFKICTKNYIVNVIAIQNKLPTIPAKRFKFPFMGSSTGCINSPLNLGLFLLLNRLFPIHKMLNYYIVSEINTFTTKL